jgi:DNA repair exonuclease SbcCD ATPase subunit
MLITKVNRVTIISLIILLFSFFISPFPASACLKEDVKEAWNKSEKASENWEKSLEKIKKKEEELKKAISDFNASRMDAEGTFIITFLDIIKGRFEPPTKKIKRLKNELEYAKVESELCYNIWQTWAEEQRKIMQKLQALEQKMSNLEQDISSLKSQIAELKEQVEEERNQQGGSPGSEASNKLSELEAELERKEAELEAAEAEHGC